MSFLEAFHAHSPVLEAFYELSLRDLYVLSLTSKEVRQIMDGDRFLKLAVECARSFHIMHPIFRATWSDKYTELFFICDLKRSHRDLSDMRKKIFIQSLAEHEKRLLSLFPLD